MITKICAALLLLFTVATLVVGYRNENNKRVKCGESSFFNATRQACQACGICEPGTYIKRTCSGTRDYHCKKCEPGHFSTRYTRLPGKCRMCSRCGDRPVIKRCTKTSDTVCGDCPLGTFMSFGRCISCGYCFPDFGIDIPREPACEKPQIPASHRCTVLIVDPYDPPYLVSRADDDGNQYFVSSYTLLPKKSDTPHDNARLLIDDKQTSQGESHTTTIPTTTKRVNMVTSVLANIPRHTAREISSRLVKYGETSYEYWLAGAGIIISLCIALTLGCISVIYRRRLSQTVTQKPYRPIVKNRQQYYAHFVDEHTKHSLKSALLDNA
ncbi:uncharacterized protein LOC120327064 [Styela clava]